MHVISAVTRLYLSIRVRNFLYKFLDETILVKSEVFK